MAREITGRLENWSKQKVHEDMGGGYIVWGDIYDDVKGRFPDGKRIHTSKIESTAREGFVLVTTYSSYMLGKPQNG